jgi:hypothetical protein
MGLCESCLDRRLKLKAEPYIYKSAESTITSTKTKTPPPLEIEDFSEYEHLEPHVEFADSDYFS